MENSPDAGPDEDTEVIRCFHHCDTKTSILCFSQIPHICPLCAQDVAQTESLIPPFHLPSPLTEAKQNPFSVVIKPTIGNFLRDYQNSSNLHIGLTNSEGVVYDFDECGVNIGSLSWDLCIAVALIQNLGEQTAHFWDALLNQFVQKDDWLPQRYHEDQHNCFTFVMEFFQYSHLLEVIPTAASKKKFTEEFLLPHIQKVSKYIAMYRQIATNGYLCLPCSLIQDPCT